MRKITMILSLLFVVATTMMAQIKTDTEYRIKEKSSGLYLTVGGTSANTHGEVYGSLKKDGDAASVQIFTFIDAGNGQFYLKSNSGEYISYSGAGAGWNVNADDNVSNAHALTFEEVGVNEFKIKCYNQSKSANKYFKWEYVGASGKYHPFNDADAGATFVVEQENLPEYTVIYEYSYNDAVVKTVTNTVVEGNAYPPYDLNLYAASYEGVPTGTVTKDETVTITVTFGEMPFEYSSDYQNAVWYNIVMHSNRDSNDRYRTYLGAEDGNNLVWGANQTLTNPSNAYFWAFIGNPWDGFKVVNKDKGANFILTADKSNDPQLLEEGTLSEDYNRIWTLAARKYDLDSYGGNDHDFVEDGNWFCIKHPGRNSYMNANAGQTKVSFWTDSDNGSAMLAVKPISVSKAAGVSTYYSSTAIEIPTDLAEAYYVDNEGLKNGYVRLKSLESPIRHETGVIIKKDNIQDDVWTYAPKVVCSGEYEVGPGNLIELEAVDGNLLKGTTKKTLIAKEANNEYYVLAMTEGLGFYRAVNKENENEFYNGAFRAYLEMPAAQGQGTAAFFGFDWDNVTGVDNVVTEGTGAKVIYDLSGRRVKEITTSGLYIVNGKKVYVK